MTAWTPAREADLAAPRTCATRPGPNQYERARMREELLLRTLAHLARNSLPCPTARAMSALLGLKGSDGGIRVLDRLVDDGRVTILAGGKNRVVHIPSLGLTTAVPQGCARDGKYRRPIAEIIDIAAEVACLPVSELLGHDRLKLQIRPRYCAVAFARAEGWSFNAIGQAMGRDHSSIVHAAARSKDMLERDTLFARLYRRTAARLEETASRPALPAPAEASSAAMIGALRREHLERCAA